MKIGFLKNFKSADTLLLIGTIEEYLQLYSDVEKYLNSDNQVLDLSREPYIFSEKGVKLALVKGGSIDPYEYQLDCNRVDILSVLLAIQRSGNACHHYINLEKTDVQLLFSIGEYDCSVFNESSNDKQ